MKKLLITIISLSLLLGTTAYATEDNANVKSRYPDRKYEWYLASQVKLEKATSLGDSWHFFYQGHPAKRTGEVDEISVSATYSNQISVGVCGEILSKITPNIDYTIGESHTLSASKYSAELKKGEYVKGYYRESYKDTQFDFRLYEKDLNGHIIRIVKKSQVHTYEAILPEIKLDYIEPSDVSTRSTVNDSTSLIKSEYYQPDQTGKYQLIQTVYY